MKWKVYIHFNFNYSLEVAFFTIPILFKLAPGGILTDIFCFSLFQGSRRTGAQLWGGKEQVAPSDKSSF